MKRKQFEWLILSMLTGTALIVLLLRIIFTCSYLPETGGVSINVMYGIQHLFTAGTLYLNPENPPFSIIQYMPLHYYIVVFTAKLFQTGGDTHSLMMVHRFYCILFDLMSLITIVFFIRKLFSEIGSRMIYMVALFYFIMIPCINFARVDSLYMLCFINAFFNLLVYIKNNPAGIKNNLIYAGIFTSLALITKQSSFVFILLALVYLLFIQRKPKEFFLFLASAIVPAAILLPWMVPSDILAFKLNVIDGLKNGVNFNWFLEVFIKNFFLKYAFIIACGIFIGLFLLKQNKASYGFFIGISVILYFCVALFTSFKAGSGPNYYLEFIFLALIGLCFILQENPLINDKYFLFTVLILPFIILASLNDKGWGFLGNLKNAEKDYQQCTEISNYIKKSIHPGEYVLSAFHKENCLNLLLSEYALFPNREVAVYFTYPLGVFKFKEFNTLYENGALKYYIDEKGTVPGKFLEVELNSYQPDTTIGNYTVFVQRK